MQREIISVTQLNRRARQLLETQFALLWVEGELSNVSVPSSGHWYFTLKDSGAQVRCAMFRNRNMTVKFKLQQGMQVVIRARLSLYEERGDYQIIAEHLEEAGTGALQRQFETLKNKLMQEGLFADARKKSLPKMPQHIAVITSPTGAAIRDILHVLDRRFASIPVTIIPVAVQGKEAAPQIVNALEAVVVEQQHCHFDALLKACDQFRVQHEIASISDERVHVAFRLGKRRAECAAYLVPHTGKPVFHVVRLRLSRPP